ncbi:unnamed protein product [Symbiodinium pilosum]|uniref:Uncharacterized protein n=1 Tax=Symbiodinium pilosum TaxID=2952 RepID=A0A812Q9L6_SYMPI|nr:unnamed protein product [Symbiodinium pilosum]
MPDGYSNAGSLFLHVLAFLAAAGIHARASSPEPFGGDFENPFDASIHFRPDVDDSMDLLTTDPDELPLGDETWRSQPRANTGTIDPFSCVDTTRHSAIACFDFSMASCTPFQQTHCDCTAVRPICVTQSNKKASPASSDFPEKHSCCSRPGTASEGMLLGKAKESSPFAKHIMEKALSSWDTREKTKCYSTARSARGTVSLTDCKTKCLEEKREVEPKECDAILYKEKGNGKGLCFVLFGLDEPSCEESEKWQTLIYKK